MMARNAHKIINKNIQEQYEQWLLTLIHILKANIFMFVHISAHLEVQTLLK